MEPDFSGWATKPNLKCADGRTIKTDAFKHMDGKRVPLVWSHQHNDPENVLGHVILKAKDGGLRADGYFNTTNKGLGSKIMVQHGDIDSLSIFANRVVQDRDMLVHSGNVKEVSLCIGGANEGAKIDFVRLAHGDGQFEDLEDEFVLSMGSDSELEVTHAAGDGETAQDIYNAMSQKQKDVVNFLIGAAIEAANGTAAQSDESGEPSTDLNDDNNDGAEDNAIEHEEGNADVTKNVFDQSKNTKTEAGEDVTLSHADVQQIVQRAKRMGSLRDAVEEYAFKHGIENLDILFPDAKNITGTPDYIKRQTEWVAGVLNGVSHTPFARIKTMLADITQDEARAKGYTTGNLKKEEWISVSQRTTGPTTVYKKQKLDRDNIIDITDFDVVVWLKAEMRLMLEEEVAIAILIGDGRAVDDADKIKDPAGATDGNGIRSIANDHEVYTVTVNVQIPASNPDYNDLIVERFMLERDQMKGTGSPTMYTTRALYTRMLLSKDAQGVRRFRDKADLVATMEVADIVPVEAMERDTTILAVFVNLRDYNVGTDRGGEVTMFDDFDIDYNKYTYLIETRLSGALVKYKSAMAMRAIASDQTKVTPAAPTFVLSTGVVTIVATTNVTYKNADTGATLSTGDQTALDPGKTLNVLAVPAAGYFVDGSDESNWSFTRPHA